MPVQSNIRRAKYFVAVEGESEQSFVTWLQLLSEKELRIHLDVVPLGGGGFNSMLKNTVHKHKRQCVTKGAYRARFLIVDGDRAKQGDWSIDKLKSEAKKHNIVVCVQNPNHEAMLFRMLPGMERKYLAAGASEAALRKRWSSYQKPMNARALDRQFAIDDLLRAATCDPDLHHFLNKIGFPVKSAC